MGSSRLVFNREHRNCRCREGSMKYDEVLEYLYNIHARSDISLKSMAKDLEEK